jgi:formylglycine-generating enzyme required for sulfatase activity
MTAIFKTLFFAVLISAITNVSAVEQKEMSVSPSFAVKTSFKDCVDCPEMIVIPSGSFNMGSTEGETNEQPVHLVTIAKPFAMSMTEITQAQWKNIMGNEPSRFSNCGVNCPVEQVSWETVQEFVRKLNSKTGKQYRLPNEAEWEYAARAGSTSKYPWGEQASHEFANYGEDDCCMGLALGRDQWVDTSPVSSFPPNAFGLYDMVGNVWEWVEDSYHDDFNDAPSVNVAWSGDGSTHVVRGGSWNFDPEFMRVSIRSRFAPEIRINSIGFRLARSLP